MNCFFILNTRYDLYKKYKIKYYKEFKAINDKQNSTISEMDYKASRNFKSELKDGSRKSGSVLKLT